MRHRYHNDDVVHSASITPSGAFQNVTNAAVGNSAITTPSKIAQPAASFIQNIAYWKNAIGLVTCPVIPLKNLNGVTRSYKGLAITLSSGSDIKDLLRDIQA